MPSQAALERGAAAGQGILRAHRDANRGTYPETVAVSTTPVMLFMFIHGLGTSWYLFDAVSTSGRVSKDSVYACRSTFGIY